VAYIKELGDDFVYEDILPSLRHLASMWLMDPIESARYVLQSAIAMEITDMFRCAFEISAAAVVRAKKEVAAPAATTTAAAREEEKALTEVLESAKKKQPAKPKAEKNKRFTPTFEDMKKDGLLAKIRSTFSHLSIEKLADPQYDQKDGPRRVNSASTKVFKSIHTHLVALLGSQKTLSKEKAVKKANEQMQAYLADRLALLELDNTFEEAPPEPRIDDLKSRKPLLTSLLMYDMASTYDFTALCEALATAVLVSLPSFIPNNKDYGWTPIRTSKQVDEEGNPLPRKPKVRKTPAKRKEAETAKQPAAKKQRKAADDD
jgi:hypothetical protein